MNALARSHALLQPNAPSGLNDPLRLNDLLRPSGLLGLSGLWRPTVPRLLAHSAAALAFVLACCWAPQPPVLAPESLVTLPRSLALVRVPRALEPGAHAVAPPSL